MLAAENFATRLAKANLVTKTDFDAKLQNLNKTRNYFVGDDGAQNYLVFQPINKYFIKISRNENILEWKSKGLSNKVIEPFATINNSLIPN